MMNQSSSHNPYQAASPSGEVEIALARPWEFEINITPEDWTEHFRYSRKREKIALFGFVIAVLVGVFQWSRGDQSASAILTLAIATFIALMLYIANDPSRQAKHFLSHELGLSGPMNVRIASRSFRVIHQEQVWHYLWSGICKLRLSQVGLLITIEAHGPEVLLPKQKLGSHWDELVTALRPSIPAIRLLRGSGGDIEEVAKLCGEAPTEAIRYDLSVTEADFAALFKSTAAIENQRSRTMRRIPLWLVFALMIAAIFIGLAVTIYQRAQQGQVFALGEIAMAMFFILLPLVVLALVVVFFRWAARRRTQSDNVLASIGGWLGDPCLVQYGRAGCQRMPYSQLMLVEVTETTIIIRHQQRPHYYLLKRDAFADQPTWQQAIETVRQINFGKRLADST